MNILDIFNESGLLYDRFLGDEPILPWTFEQVQIQINETCTNNLINLKLQHLYDNYLYLYKSTKIASNLIPISAFGILGVGPGPNFAWFNNLSTSQFLPMTAAHLYDVDRTDYVNIQANRDLPQFTLFTSSGSDLVIFNSNTSFSTVTQIISTRELYTNSGTFFSQIACMDFDNEYNCYIIDLSANRLSKHDASGFLTNDTVTNNTLVFTDAIGGPGTYKDKTQFASPRSVVFSNPYVYVLDSGNSCIKQYDVYLNWINTYGLYRDFLSAYPIDLKVDSLSGNFWVLTDNLQLFEYTPDFSSKTIIDLTALQSNGETFQQLMFSKSNPNIFYLISNQNVYKKLVDTPDDTVGKYLLYLFDYNTNETIYSFGSTSFPVSTASDCNIIFSKSGNVGKFGAFYDNINLFSLLITDGFDVYTPEEVYINVDEYTQNWVFNKSLSKLIANHLRLIQQIDGKFVGQRDANNNIVFQNARYLTALEYASINFTANITYFIGLNEIFQNIIVNRALGKIYDIQTSILAILQNDIVSALGVSTIVFID